MKKLLSLCLLICDSAFGASVSQFDTPFWTGAATGDVSGVTNLPFTSLSLVGRQAITNAAATAGTGQPASSVLTNAANSVLTTNNSTLTANILIGNGSRGAVNGAASGAVPANADGSASTWQQVANLAAGVPHTNGMGITATFSNVVSMSGTFANTNGNLWLTNSGITGNNFLALTNNSLVLSNLGNGAQQVFVITNGGAYLTQGITNASNVGGKLWFSGTESVVAQFHSKDYVQADVSVIAGTAGDAGFRRLASGSIEFDNGNLGVLAKTTHGALVVSNSIIVTNMSMTLAGDATSTSATLASLSLTNYVISGHRYSFKCILYVSDSTATDGVQIDFGGGTATATNFRCHVTSFDSALNLSTQLTSLTAAATMSTFTGAGMIEVHGSFEPSASGSFIPRFAQAAHTVGTLTCFRGSHILMEETP